VTLNNPVALPSAVFYSPVLRARAVRFECLSAIEKDLGSDDPVRSASSEFRDSDRISLRGGPTQDILSRGADLADEENRRVVRHGSVGPSFRSCPRRSLTTYRRDEESLGITPCRREMRDWYPDRNEETMHSGVGPTLLPLRTLQVRTTPRNGWRRILRGDVDIVMMRPVGFRRSRVP
jgi:hypothetical protein